MFLNAAQPRSSDDPIRQAERAEQKRSQIGSGDRSERIRTYNYRENRVTDHRLGKNYSLEQVVAGDLGKVVEGLREMHREEELAGLEEKLGHE